MENKMEKIVSLCKRRGFVFQGSEISGGLSGVWDYGPLGVRLKENIKREWWKHMLRKDHIYPLDSAILMNEKIFKTSGHLEHFSDPLVDCKKCKKRFHQDEISGKKCLECGGGLTEPRQFNLMFAVGDVYLRPETAQGIFANFKNVLDSFHPTLPFGIAQVGKAFRNEIAPENFLFRAREFEQMELEYFGAPEKQKQYFEDIKNMRMEWFLNLGIKKENIRFHDYEKNELAHYSQATTDIEYRFGLSKDGFSELEGIAMRGNYDLSAYAKAFGEDLTIEGVIPHVIEPSLGLDRAFLAFLLDTYEEDELGGEKRIVLRLHPKLAPIKVAVFPLMANKENLINKAREVYKDLRSNFSRLTSNFQVVWDDIGNVGKRYRRQDEIGTPWCVTIDYQTLEDDTVTIRNRDTGEQIRHSINELENYFAEKLA